METYYNLKKPRKLYSKPQESRWNNEKCFLNHPTLQFKEEMVWNFEYFFTLMSWGVGDL
jgi:hypothetical protein